MDTWVVSLVWGRIGAAVLVVASVALSWFGYEFGTDDQQVVYNSISTVLGGLGAAFAVASKIREKRK